MILDVQKINVTFEGHIQNPKSRGRGLFLRQPVLARLEDGQPVAHLAQPALLRAPLPRQQGTLHLEKDEVKS